MKSMHNGSYQNGKYVYDFPPSWGESLTQNKAIALRRIDTRANAYIVNVTFTIADQDIPVWASITSDSSIQEALSTIALAFNRIYKPDGYLICIYNPLVNTVALTLSTGVDFTITAEEGQDDFWHLLNQADGAITANPAKEFIFPNVWDRQELFIHASFVTNTTAGYLGRGGEFYYKPSKIYPCDSQSSFYLELSFDGYNKTLLPYENFIVELIFIMQTAF
jgi:hypothetical protein